MPSAYHPLPTLSRNRATASKFGADDQIGNLNYITAEKTLAASKLITKGKSYRLAIETNNDVPAFPPRTFSIVVLQPGQAAGGTLGATKTTYKTTLLRAGSESGQALTVSVMSALTTSILTATKLPISLRRTG